MIIVFVQHAEVFISYSNEIFSNVYTYSYCIIEENAFRLMNSLGILLIIYFWFSINNSKNKNSDTNVSGIISFFFFLQNYWKSLLKLGMNPRKNVTR